MRTSTARNARRGAWASALACCVMLLASCGDSGSGTGSGDGSSGDGEVKFRIGISAAKVSNPTARQAYAGFVHRGEELGLEVDVNDANLDINKQISDIDAFVNADFDAVMIHLVGDPNAIRGPVQRAIEAGVKVFSFDELPTIEGVSMSAMYPNQEAAQASAEWIVDQLGGEGKVAVVGGPPIPTLMTRWETATEVFESNPGIEVLERQDSIPDDASGGRALGDNLLNQYSDVDAIWTVNDPVASGIGQAVRSADRDVIVTGINGDEEGIEGIKQGYISAAWDVGGLELGARAAEAALDILSGDVSQDEPVIVTVDTVEYTSENVDDWVRPEDRIPYPDLG